MSICPPGVLPSPGMNYTKPLRSSLEYTPTSPKVRHHHAPERAQAGRTRDAKRRDRETRRSPRATPGVRSGPHGGPGSPILFCGGLRPPGQHPAKTVTRFNSHQSFLSYIPFLRKVCHHYEMIVVRVLHFICAALLLAYATVECFQGGESKAWILLTVSILNIALSAVLLFRELRSDRTDKHQP